MKTAHDLVVAAKSRVQEIPVQDAEQAIREADVLVDVREVDEYAAGHLPGAVHISRGLLEFKFSGAPALQARDLKVVLVTELGHALMVHLDIGMKINTLTVVALGVGIGVDYGIYIFARMRESLLAGHALTDAYFASLKTTGIAIFYTALTLAVGVGT